MGEVPTFDEYMKPIVAALRRLGGSATINELYEAVVDEAKLSDEQLAVLHDPERGDQTEAAYRMAWARTWLKKAGFLENSSRGVWALTPKGREQEVDPDQVVADVRAAYAAREATAAPAELPGIALAPEVISDVAEPDAPADWHGRLMRRLQRLAPDAFERLCQRILRESGFVEVRVTGRSGDGGIDGIGILRMQRVVSFQVLFQCKKYQGTVG
jgi:restriction system protein